MNTPRSAPVAVIACGVAAAVHVGKLPPALPALQAELGLTLVEAGFLLSLVQGAGMTAGLAFGALADSIGARRSMLAGLALLAMAGLLGGATTGAGWLMALRAIEGCGFLLVVLPGPGLLRQLVAPQHMGAAIGVWGSYMPLATALALLLGPLAIAASSWRVWWWMLAAVSALAALALIACVPAHTVRPAAATAASPGWWRRLLRTLAAPGPWLVAMTFAAYSAQWLALIGFLPTIYAAAGFSAAATGALTALVAAMNITGNLGAGRALQRGTPPPRLLALGFGTMAAASLLAFAPDAPPPLRYAAVLAFSGLGGVIPATLFALALRLAPDPRAPSSTLGWVQQWSAFGQFVGPPVVAAVASRAGGWQLTGWVLVAFGAVGLATTTLLVRATRTAPR